MRRNKRRPGARALQALYLMLVVPGLALAEGVTPTEAGAGSLLWQMEQGYSNATALSTDVDMQVNGLVARVAVRQEFRNDSTEWVEGIYVFPLPDKAAVDRMRLHIGDRYIEGEIQEKERARKTYEQAKHAGKKTSLVEQQRANLFTTSVANVAPGELVVVEIEYLEDIRYEDGRFSLRFPMTLTPRYIPGRGLPDKVGSGWSGDTDRVPDASLITPPMVTTSRAHRVTLEAAVNAGTPLEIVASRYHPVSVTEQDGHYLVSLKGSDVPLDHDFELVWQPVPSAEPRAMAFTELVNGQPHHLLMVMPPDQQASSALSLPREIILVVDTSGSMHGVSIAQAKQALRLALRGLKTTDRFNVIQFNSHTSALFASSVAATTENVSRALRFVQQLQANGGTEMRPALARAFRGEPLDTHLRQIVFITDGSVGNEDELFTMIEAKLSRARLFTVGIGSAPNSWFMRKAAEAGRGSYTFISALHEVGEKMDRLFVKLAHPQVTDISVQWPSGVVVDSYPKTVPDLYIGEPVTVKVRASGGYRDGDTVRVSGNSIGGGWSRSLSLQSAQQGDGIAALWGRARIAELMNRERRGEDAVRDAIVETALAHSIVSKYTSLVAVDKTPARPAGEALSSEQVPNLLPYGQSGNAIFGFPATASNAPQLRLIGSTLLLSGLLLFAVLRMRERYCRVGAA
ncbi:MAG: marine proteobacterial sortase target protein [Woeseiaceae bacterium]